MTLDLTIACGEYDRTIALQSGAVVPKGINLHFLARSSSGRPSRWRFPRWRTRLLTATPRWES